MPITVEQWIKDVKTRYRQQMAHISDIELQMSIGISYWPTESGNLVELTKMADERMYEMKLQHKRNQLRL